MKKIFFLFFALMATCLSYAGDKDSLEIAQAKILRFIDSVNHAMKYQTGLVKLPNGVAQLNVPAGFKYLNKEQSNYVITDLWGNPPRQDVLGMIFPEKANPLSDTSGSLSYAFIVSYDEMGFVKDDDADKIDYDQMLKETHEAEPAENKEREKEGYPPIHFVRWAQKPFYDNDKKVLHWAKELQFGNDAEETNTLNYDVRILGRKGVLSLNAVATVDELSLVKQDIDKVLNMASFTDGNAYKDFDPGIDKVAAWTIGGLVAGKVIAKVGLLAVLGKFFAVAWKFILIGLVAIGGFFKKFFTRKKNQANDTNDYQPEPVPVAAIETPAPDASAGQPGESHNV